MNTETLNHEIPNKRFERDGVATSALRAALTAKCSYMRKHINFAIGILLIFQMPFAQADFLGDRCYVNSNAPLEPKIVRLYIGKEGTNKCLGNTIENCIEWLGKPDKIETISDKEKRYIFYGTKQLYWGTGSDNKQIGLEWREMMVVDGTVNAEYSTVQMLELGYSWIPSKPIMAFGSPSYNCEPYGECGTTLCYGLTPIEPLPPLQQSPAILGKYTAEELLVLYRQLVYLDVCSDLSQENKNIRSTILQHWSMTKPGLVDALENTQEYPLDVGTMKENTGAGGSKQSQDDISIYCESLLAQLTAEIAGPDDRFSTPEKTW